MLTGILILLLVLSSIIDINNAAPKKLGNKCQIFSYDFYAFNYVSA